MNLNADRVEKPLRKLRKMLKDFPADPQPDQVHTLRTQTRRLEAVLAVLLLQTPGKRRRLLKRLTPLRRAAGHVRDMDVLIGEVVSLGEEHSTSHIRLIESLSEIRRKRAMKLVNVVARDKGETRRQLKRCGRILRSCFGDEPSAIGNYAGPQILMAELRHWPRLKESNLHSFRIKVKSLGYMLQLSKDADGRFIERLNAVKDSIGEWHDWFELHTQAANLLDPERDSELLQQIGSAMRRASQAALASAIALRRDYFDVRRESNTHLLQKAAGF